MKNTRNIFFQLLAIFLLAFMLNLVWEELHHVLYVHYQGGEITQGILLRAALFDASFITSLGVLCIFFLALRRRLWLAALMGLIFAVGLEWWALDTGRWAYTAAMPIIPIFNIGLTPTIQLGILGYFSLRAVLGCETCFS